MTRLIVRQLGNLPYEETWQRMKWFTEKRDAASYDELWWLEHPPVYTIGQAGKAEHIIDPMGIPVVNTDRGGDVTYHGPGQLVGYLLIDIKRLGIDVRTLVSGIERSLIDFMGKCGVAAMARKDAPGVYVDGCKVAALGLRVRKGRSYHGMSLNVDMDLSPFAGINPCGHEGLEVVDLKALGLPLTIFQAAALISPIIGIEFAYDALIHESLNSTEYLDG